MRMSYFGDSYDFVKQSLLRCLRDLGPWSSLPMLTEEATRSELSSFAAFLGTDLVSSTILAPGADRASYFASACKCGHLFVDPNTGIRVEERGGRTSNYIFASELVNLAGQRPRHLTMVFDQALSRGAVPIGLERKLKHLAAQKIFGFAYVSHACFMIVGKDRVLVNRARRTLIKKCRLPEHRLLTVTSA